MTSLVSFALGLCAKRALDGATWATQVLLEPQAPVEVLAPVIAIYVGRGRSEISGRDWLNADGETLLRFDLIVPAALTVAGIDFSADSSQAMLLALLWRQVVTVLSTSTDPWPSLFNRFFMGAKSKESLRDLFEGLKGQKLAVCVVEMRAETMAEPAIGAPPQGVWGDLVTAMRADGGELALLANLIESYIEGTPAALPDWQVAMGLLGATADEINAIGLGPGLQVSDSVNTVDNFGPSIDQLTESATPTPGP